MKNMFWFISDLPVLMTAMSCYLIAGIWTLIEWKYRQPPSANQHNTNLSTSPLPSGNTTVSSNREKKSNRKSNSGDYGNSQMKTPQTQKSIGESTRQMVCFKVTFQLLCLQFTRNFSKVCNYV